MSEPLMSVAGQLVGIPAEKYSGTNGITVDQNNKTIGLDETVLYTGNLGVSSQATLSESWHNFERIKVFGYSEPGGAMCNEASVSDLEAAEFGGIAVPDINLSTISSWRHNSNFIITVSLPVIFSANTTVNTLNGRLMGYWDGSWQVSFNETRLHVTKIVGINRISGGNA